jgi:hypothetical protein
VQLARRLRRRCYRSIGSRRRRPAARARRLGTPAAPSLAHYPGNSTEASSTG